MTQSEARASSDFALALSVAQEILRLISGQRAILTPEGRVLAQSPQRDELFEAALANWGSAPVTRAGDQGLSEAVFGPGTPLEGCRLISSGTSARPNLDPMLLHDVRDLLHGLQLRLEPNSPASAAQSTQSTVAKIATQVETLLHNDNAPTPLRLVALLRDLAETLQPVLAADGTQLTLDMPAEEIEITLPRGALQSLVQNLLLNAAQQSRGGEVTMTLRPPSDTGTGPQLEIADGGTGLSKARLDWINSPKADLSTPESKGGHGYGLSIIRQALAQIGARLEQREGAPHSLRVQLPATAQPSRGASLDGRLIWLAENNATTAALLAGRLRASGAGCQIFSTGEALIEAAAESEAPPDLILCDYFMGDYNGSALCQLLTSSGFPAPVIILTADSDAETAALSRLSGAIEVWLKPISGAALIARLSEVLSSTAQRTEVPIFDPEIAPELLAEAGILKTVEFMGRALDEARDITPLCSGNDIGLLRSALHSAIGASAITGLQLINERLKNLHAKVVSGLPRVTELRELEYSIDWTSRAITKIQSNEMKTVPKY